MPRKSGGFVELYEIPGFRRYVTDEHGVVTSVESGREMSCYGRYEQYQLFDDEDIRRKISRDQVLTLVFGGGNAVNREGMYGRRPVKEFPDYEIDQTGDVYGSRTGERLAFKVARNSMYYTFHQGGKRYNRTLLSLLRDNFPSDGT